MSKIKIMTVLTALFVVVLTGCAGGPLSTRERMTYGGGALGAATGAIIGAATGSAAVGAVIGGPVGAIGGYLIGDSIQSHEAATTSYYRPSAPAGSSYQVRGYSRKTKSASRSSSSSGTQDSATTGQVF